MINYLVIDIKNKNLEASKGTNYVSCRHGAGTGSTMTRSTS